MACGDKDNYLRLSRLLRRTACPDTLRVQVAILNYPRGYYRSTLDASSFPATHPDLTHRRHPDGIPDGLRR